MAFEINELISLRGETSKTFDIGGRKRRFITGGGIQHWKYDYSDKSEEWKECDLRWDGNRINKAPYILVRDGNKLTFTDRKTGETSTIELVSIKPSLKPEIIPFNSGVHFQHKVPNLNVPFEASFKVTGKVPVSRAYDDEGELELEVSYDEKTGVLTERLSEVRSADSKELRQASGEIRIDPTLTVQPSSKDNHLIDTASTTNYGTSVSLTIGFTYLGSPVFQGYIYRGLFEFDVDWSGMESITKGELSLYASNVDGSDTYTASRLLRLDWHETQSTWNIYKTGSNWGTAGCANTTSDYTTTDAVGITISSTGWKTWDITNQVDWAFDNTSDVACRIAGTTTSGTTSKRFLCHSNDYTTDTDLCPKLVIEYTEAGVTHKASTSMALRLADAGVL